MDRQFIFKVLEDLKNDDESWKEKLFELPIYLVTLNSREFTEIELRDILDFIGINLVEPEIFDYCESYFSALVGGNMFTITNLCENSLINTANINYIQAMVSEKFAEYKAFLELRGLQYRSTLN